MTDVLHRVETFLKADPYYRCLLLVHPEVRRLHAAGDMLNERFAWPQLAIGRDLSAVLLSLAQDSRPPHARQWIEARLWEMRPGPVLCTDIDLLFEPSLRLDPLALLRAASRSTTMVVLWPGAYEHGILSYAAPAHDHFRPLPDPQVSIETLT